ncbi:MAG: 16S rRNA (uracil(1498)-N(3))-methyltransferase [Candidatus Jordarchaeaceae archaeon]
MKRVFILKASTVHTNGKFTIKDLPGTSGRIDLVCRCILSALLLSNTHRVDTIFYAVLEGPPRPPLIIEVDGEKIEKMPRDELQLGLTLKEILCGGEESFLPGFRLINKAFKELVEEQRNKSEMYYLHQSGNSIKEKLDKFKKTEKHQLTFLLGDHIGFNQKDIEYFKENDIKPLSLGPKEYLGSHCIFLVHEKLDRIFEPKTALNFQRHF